MNDADIEMFELEQAGNMLAAGVCPRCEDMLDPHHPKWADSLGQTHDRYGRPLPERSVHRLDADAYARLVGPHSNILEGFHDRCVDDHDGEAW